MGQIKRPHRRFNKVGKGEFKQHHLGLSDNVSYFSEQIEATQVSDYHCKIRFKPQAIIPDVDFKGSLGSLKELAN